MDQHFPSAIVTGYEPLIARLDARPARHVVAEAANVHVWRPAGLCG